MKTLRLGVLLALVSLASAAFAQSEPIVAPARTAPKQAICFDDGTQHCTNVSAANPLPITGGGGGGGGGASTIADGADVALGAKADTVASTDTATASLIALQKRVNQSITALNALLTTANGYQSTIATAAADTTTAAPIFYKPNATSASTNVTAATSSTTLLAANTARLGCNVVNDSTAIMYLKLSATASSTSYDYFMAGSVSGVPSQFECPRGWTGAIYGIWASATGAARVSERTP